MDEQMGQSDADISHLKINGFSGRNCNKRFHALALIYLSSSVKYPTQQMEFEVLWCLLNFLGNF